MIDRNISGNVYNCFLPQLPMVPGYGYFTYCVGVSSPEWCHRMFPSVYSHVQDKYWDVGFLRFYKELNRVSMCSNQRICLLAGLHVYTFHYFPF